VTAKTWTRRRERDLSLRIRHAVQLGFLLLNFWIGVQFYLFVRYFEKGGWNVGRPPGVEGWLPIAGMMNTSYLVQSGRIPQIHPAAMVLFLAFLSLSIAFRKAFCGWLCPVGTISEQLWKYGRQMFRRVFFPPRWLDVPLRGLKYLLLALFVWAVATMSAAGIRSFLAGPYGMIAEVKMLGFFRSLTPAAAVVIGILVLGSFFVPNLWCRYLCPYGALMGLGALVSPMRIRRDPVRCIDCAKCAKACPAALPIDRLIHIRSAECIGCLECLAVCPSEGALILGVRKSRRVSPYAVAIGIAIILVVSIGAAKLTGHWQSPISDVVYRRLIPIAAELGHP
jgi:polyferredoxin